MKCFNVLLISLFFILTHLVFSQGYNNFGVSGAPLAFGVVSVNGSKLSGTENWTSTYDSTDRYYEITIENEGYHFLYYSTIVTPVKDNHYCRTASGYSKLRVYCYSNGNLAASDFSFMIFEGEWEGAPIKKPSWVTP